MLKQFEEKTVITRLYCPTCNVEMTDTGEVVWSDNRHKNECPKCKCVIHSTERFPMKNRVEKAINEHLHT